MSIEQINTQETGNKDHIRFDALNGPDSREKLAKLLDQSFPVAVESGSHFFDDFPVWDENLDIDRERTLRLGAFHNDRLVGSACVKLSLFRSSTAAGSPAWPVALIGAVATDPSWRGKGLASSLVSSAVEWSQSSGAGLALLWGSEHQLYQRLGFGLHGEQLRFPLRALQWALAPAKPSQVYQGWNPELFGLMQDRPGGQILTEADTRWISAHKNVLWFWTGTPDFPTAYLAVGRGIDLSGIIHEWGGEKSALARLLNHLALIEPELQLLGNRSLLEKFGISAEPEKVILESLCLAKILDPALLEGAPLKAVASQLLTRFWVWGLDAC
jgi:GNAT superfamily N-acetyltransferase